MNEDEVRRILHVDPFSDGLRQAMSAPTQDAVRSELVIALVGQLHEVLSDHFISGAEAYRIFVRTISVLDVLLPEGKRR